MTQQLLRSLRQWPWLHHLNYGASLPLLLHHHHFLISSQPTNSITSRPFLLAPLASSKRNVHSRRSRGLRISNVPLLDNNNNDDRRGGNEDSEDLEIEKSRNQMKREAKRAVKWGMDLASFSPSQIKRILRVFSLDQVVYEALTIVKKLGPDVREGKRRQFNYIGKLLRDVEPELMDRLLTATKNSDHKELQALTGLGAEDLEDDDVLIETEDEEEEEESNCNDNQVTRWFDGLIDKDIQITNEVYSIQGVEFDRQELRKLVRRVHSSQEMKGDNEKEEKKAETATIGAKKALTRFLRGIAKRIPSEYEHINL
ncbi:hypothetical protein Lal_00047213 [Lupinus albus]|uniref:Putative ribosome-associated, YjgA, PSPTO4464-like domain-containing protein n=1 Tax=Lupinus albus TaxID=3870 RepID=A0A6A4QYR5_LUPAL|nr:putative ribosome-associated, YjgA, PSPTO4464-like domain-containing protein [Lupinus albus]KAF1878544.1 hypothetical protein Lal_00047213 [Lupinus albus]